MRNFRRGHSNGGHKGAAALALTVAAVALQGENRLSRALIADGAAQAAPRSQLGHLQPSKTWAFVPIEPREFDYRNRTRV